MFLLLAPALSVGSVSALPLFARLFCLLFLLRDGGGSGSVIVLLLQKLLHRPISIFLLLFGLRGASLQQNILLPPVNTFVLVVPYQRGDSSVPLALSNLQRSSAIISLEVDVTARSKELRCDGSMPISGCEVERRAPSIILNINATARSNELFRDGDMPFIGRMVQRCDSILILNINLT